MTKQRYAYCDHGRRTVNRVERDAGEEHEMRGVAVMQMALKGFCHFSMHLLHLVCLKMASAFTASCSPMSKARFLPLHCIHTTQLCGFKLKLQLQIE